MTAHSIRESSVPAHAGVFPFPTARMLYTVKFHYCRVVHAESSKEAFDKVCRQIKEDPATVINRVDWGSAPRKKPCLLARLILGA